MNYLENAKAVGTKVIQIVASVVTKATKALASYVGEALSTCETKKAAADIQAQAYLYNAERLALREPPIIYLDSLQENCILPPEFCGMNTCIKLNNNQAEQVFWHMLRQHALDTDSKRELAEAITPLVGIPTLMQSVYKAHEEIGKSLVLPYINHGKPDEYKKVYSDIVNAPFYEGTNRSIRLHYNLHSADLCEKFCGEYRKSRQYNAGLENDLQRIGVQISHVRANGIHLEVYLKWA